MYKKIRFPDFIIIGAMRCGSTTLWELISKHPSVFFPEKKELHFFDDKNSSYGLGLKWYSNNFCNANRDAIAGEATPTYLYLDEARKRILNDIPQSTKFIVILRDPALRAWSHYWFRVRQGLESRSFNRSTQMEETRISSAHDWTWLRFAYRKLGHYAEFLYPWLDSVERKRFHFVFLEDLIRNPISTMNSVFSHIDVDANDIEKIELPHKNKGWHCLSPKLQKYAHTLATFEPDQIGLSYKAIRRFGRTLRHLNRSKKQIFMPETVYFKMMKVFEKSDSALENMLGIQVPWRKNDYNIY